MRGAPAGIEQTQVCAVGVGGKHARGETAALAGFAPAVEKDETLAAGGVEQVVEPVLGAGPVGDSVIDFGGVGEREQQLALTAGEFDAPNAGVVGRGDIAIGVGDAGVAGFGADVVEAAEVVGER